MTGTAGHLEGGVGLGKLTGGQVIGDQGVIANAAKLVHQQAVSAVVLVILVELEDGGALHPLVGVEGVRGDVGPRAQQGVGHFHIHGLGLGTVVVGGTALVLGVAVVLAVLHAVDDGGVNGGLVHLNEHLGLGEGVEVPGLGVIQPLLGVAVLFHLGGPVHHILSGEGVVGGLGGPGAAGVNASADGDHAHVGPVHQVGGLPHHQGLAASGLGSAPAVAAVDLQVGGDEVELVPLGRADNEGVTDALLALVGGEHGVVAVQVGPVQAVLAGGKVDLLAVGVALASKVGEEVVGVVLLADLLRGGLHGEGDVLGDGLVGQSHLGGDGDHGVTGGTGDSAGGGVVIALHGGGDGLHVDNVGPVGGPGDVQAVGGGLRQGDVAPHIVLVGDVDGLQGLGELLVHVQRHDSDLQLHGVALTVHLEGHGDGDLGLLAHHGVDGAVGGDDVGVIPGAPGEGHVVQLGGEGEVVGDGVQAGVVPLDHVVQVSHDHVRLVLRGGQRGLDLRLAQGVGPDLHIGDVGLEQGVQGVQGLADVAHHVALGEHVLDGLVLGDGGHPLPVQIQAQGAAPAHQSHGAEALHVAHAAVHHGQAGLLPGAAGAGLDGGQEVAVALTGIDEDVVPHVLVVPVAEAVADGQQPVGGVGLGGDGGLHGEVLTVPNGLGDGGGQGGIARPVQLPHGLIAIGDEVAVLGVIQGGVVAVAGHVHQGVALVGHVVGGHQLALVAARLASQHGDGDGLLHALTVDGDGHRDGDGDVAVHRGGDHAVSVHHVGVAALPPGKGGAAHGGGEVQITGHLIGGGVAAEHLCHDVVHHQIGQYLHTRHAGLDLLLGQGLVIDLHVHHIGGEHGVGGVEGLSDVAQHIPVGDDVGQVVVVVNGGDGHAVQVGGDGLVLADHGEGVVAVAPAHIGHAAALLATGGLVAHLNAREGLSGIAALVGLGAHKQVVANAAIPPVAHAITDDPGPLSGVAPVHRQGDLHGAVVVRLANQPLGQGGVLLVGKVQYIGVPVGGEIPVHGVVQRGMVVISRHVQQLIAAVGHVIVGSGPHRLRRSHRAREGHQRQGHHRCQGRRCRPFPVGLHSFLLICQDWYAYCTIVCPFCSRESRSTP